MDRSVKKYNPGRKKKKKYNLVIWVNAYYLVSFWCSWWVLGASNFSVFSYESMRMEGRNVLGLIPKKDLLPIKGTAQSQ